MVKLISKQQINGSFRAFFYDIYNHGCHFQRFRMKSVRHSIAQLKTTRVRSEANTRDIISIIVENRDAHRKGTKVYHQIFIRIPPTAGR